MFIRILLKVFDFDNENQTLSRNFILNNFFFINIFYNIVSII